MRGKGGMYKMSIPSFSCPTHRKRERERGLKKTYLEGGDSFHKEDRLVQGIFFRLEDELGNEKYVYGCGKEDDPFLPSRKRTW